MVLLAVVMSLLVLLTACIRKEPVKEKPVDTKPTDAAVEDSIFDKDNSSETEDTKPADDEPEATTKPKENATKPTTKPTTKPKPTTPSGSDTVNVDYKEFLDMTAAEQQAFAESFDKLEDFFGWLNKARDLYKKENPSIEIGDDGTINMEDLLK